MRFLSLISLMALALTTAAPALAQTAASAATDTLWSAIATYAYPVLSGVVGLAITLACAQVARLTGVQVSQAAQDSLHRAADTGLHIGLDKAGVLVGQALSGTTKSAVMAEAVAWVTRSVPDALDTLGVTPAEVESLVLSKLSKTLRTSLPSPAAVESEAMEKASGPHR